MNGNNLTSIFFSLSINNSAFDCRPGKISRSFLPFYYTRENGGQKWPPNMSNSNMSNISSNMSLLTLDLSSSKNTSCSIMKQIKVSSKKLNGINIFVYSTPDADAKTNSIWVR